MPLIRATLPTPVGPMLAVASDESLCALEFTSESRLTRLDTRLERFFTSHEVVEGTNAVVEQVRAWLDAYFAGASADIGALPLAPRGTPFERRVWGALQTILPGETRSYAQVAAKVSGSVLASRAVGLANGANPIAIIVPCHRVIGADGSLTGYGGGLERKTWLLEHEEKHWPTDTSFSRAQPHPKHRVSKDEREPRFEF